MIYQSDLICIKRIPGKGRGVFARAFIRKGSIIERVPLLLIPIQCIFKGLLHPQLARFFYLRSRDKVAIALGYGSLYNHSYKPNALYEHENGAVMVYRALRNIYEGEEICVNYNGDPKDKADVGFPVID